MIMRSPGKTEPRTLASFTAARIGMPFDDFQAAAASAYEQAART